MQEGNLNGTDRYLGGHEKESAALILSQKSYHPNKVRFQGKTSQTKLDNFQEQNSEAHNLKNS